MPDEFAETKLLLQCGSQEELEKLLGDLFMGHQERLRRMVQMRLDSRLQGRVGISDVLQETYMEALQRIGEYLKSPDVSFFLWLRFLTGQKIQTFHRQHLGAKIRDVRRQISLYHGAMPQATSAALAAQLLGKGTSPSERVIRAERKILLQEALNRMDSMDREIISLRHFEHLSSAEAGRALGILESAAKKRYFRALKRLKENLARLGEI